MSVNDTQQLPPDKMLELARQAAGLDDPSDREKKMGTCPSHIGKYRVERMIGSGGMGIVYLAEHPELKRPVAIKVMRQDTIWNATRVERFINEARVASRISHPNIVTVHDVDREGDLPYIVQDYYPNDVATLLKASTRGRLSINDALNICEGVCKGLEEIWRYGIVHRDIKPENILLGSDGKPRIADLGIAKQCGVSTASSSSMPLTRKLSSMGSPMYVAPEQLISAGNVDVRADIYALGVTLYQMLTGEFPVAAATAREMVTKHRHEPLSNPRSVCPDIPKPLAAIVMKMLQYDPANRYQDPAEVLGALTRFRQRRRQRTFPWLLRIAVGLAVSALIVLSIYRQARLEAVRSVEQCLDEGRFMEALHRLQSPWLRLRQENRMLYAIGICQLEQGKSAGIEDICSKLETRKDGWEYARHLRVMFLMSQSRDEEARAIVADALPNAPHKLPFFLARGLILLQDGDLEGAENAVSQATSEAGFFHFQQLRASEILGKILLAQGKPEAAAKIYGHSIQVAQSKQPDLYTNYAVALMKSGKDTEAAKALQVALAVQPDDPVAKYLAQRSAGAEQKAKAAGMQEVRTLINELVQAIPPADPPADTWRASPRIVVFLPARTDTPMTVRLGEPERWIDLLSRQIRERLGLPVVDRESLVELLAELRLSSTGLVAGDAHLAMGRLLPASIFVRCTYSTNNGMYSLSCEIIDVQTSEIIGIADIQAEKEPELEKKLEDLCSAINATLQAYFPLVGEITGGKGKQAEINVGRVHGVRPGLIMEVHERPLQHDIRLLAAVESAGQVKAETVDAFRTSVRAIPGKDVGMELKPGMIVIPVTE